MKKIKAVNSKPKTKCLKTISILVCFKTYVADNKKIKKSMV